MERFAVKQYHYFGDLRKNTIFMHSTGKKWLWVWLECPEKKWKKGDVRKVSVMALYSPKITKKDCSLLPYYKAVNSCVVQFVSVELTLNRRSTLNTEEIPWFSSIEPDFPRIGCRVLQTGNSIRLWNHVPSFQRQNQFRRLLPLSYSSVAGHRVLLRGQPLGKKKNKLK